MWKIRSAGVDKTTGKLSLVDLAGKHVFIRRKAVLI